MDPMLPKHIMASASEYFRPIASDLGLKFFVEGVDNVTDETFQIDSFTLRVNGPVLFEGSQDVEWYKVEFQILLTDIIQRRTENGYNIFGWAGTVAAALQQPISIFEMHPDDPGEDVLIGCLEPDKTVRNNIRIVNYNVIDRDIPVRQMSVHGRFILCP